MRMLRFLRLAVFVACIAAFASGCGGGGGGGGAAVMECPQGQVGTYPDCMDPGPTDEEKIAAARQEVASILSNAQARAGAASSAAGALGANDDATADQIANALARAGDAQAALAAVVAASRAANAATTPAAAEMAVADANRALGDLMTAQSAIASIQSAVNAVAEARRQQEANEMALTGGSSLIKHLRDNKLLADAVLGAAGAKLTAASLVVDRAGTNPSISSGARTACVAPCAEYPATSEGANRVTGQRTVKYLTLVSSSTTPTLTGTGRLSNGFDLNNGTTTFVNAYTDIAPERRGARNDGTTPEDPATPYNEEYDYIFDTDYLLAGIWLNVNPTNLGESSITAFAYGGQPTSKATPNFCGSSEGTASPGVSTESGITTTTRICGNTAGFNTISTFVNDGQDVTATYNGDANGVYLAGSDTSYFTADVTLTAEFQNPTGAATGTGSIEGAVTNIVAGGQQMAGSIELQKQDLGDDIGGNDIFADGSTIGVVDGKSYGGTWKGQFFGMGRRQVTRSQTTATQHTRDADNRITATTNTITTTYSPQHPGSVAGTFYATQQSAPAGSAAFIGAFTAHR